MGKLFIQVQVGSCFFHQYLNLVLIMKVALAVCILSLVLLATCSSEHDTSMQSKNSKQTFLKTKREKKKKKTNLMKRRNSRRKRKMKNRKKGKSNKIKTIKKQKALTSEDRRNKNKQRNNSKR